MPEAEVSIADAIAVAIDRLELHDPIAATTWWIRREDRPGDSYYLVVLGDPCRAEGAAAVHSVTGEVMEWAALSGTGPHLTMNSEEATRRAGDPGGRAVLVWRPGRAGTTMLAPVWRVGSDDGLRYVDQRGTVWESIDRDARGG